MKPVSLALVMQIRGVNPYVLLSAQTVARIKPNWVKPMPVLVTVNGKPETPWEINMMPVGDGSFYLYLHGDVRKASGTKVGDTVNVSIAFNNAYQNGPGALPDWFFRELNDNPLAQKHWQQLSPSRQKEIVRYLSRLKSPEAQARNLKRAMEVLTGSNARFLGRTWKDGE